MDWDEIKKRFDALPPVSDEVGYGGRSWVDRVETWELFLRYGPRVSALLRGIRQNTPPEVYERDIRCDGPEHHDLLLEVFPDSVL